MPHEGLAPEGLLVVDKPSGMTSHDVVAHVRRALGTRRVGHAGTLDPMATGVLVCGVGRATRLLGLLALTDKEYLATMRLGVSTGTDDAEGVITGRVAAHLTADQVEQALDPLRGTIQQRPSAVSAIKIDGRRAYERVRAGEAVELPTREVTISLLDIVDVRQVSDDGLDVTDVDVRVVCSSGTYVRAIARDAGESLGVGGHLTSLRRTRSGRYDAGAAVALDAVTVHSLVPIAEAAAAEMPVLVVTSDVSAMVRHGAQVDVPGDSGADRGPVAVFDSDGELLAVSDIVEGRLRHRMVLST